MLERKKNSLGLAAGERDVIRRSVPLQFHCQRTADIHVCVCVCVHVQEECVSLCPVHVYICIRIRTHAKTA